MAVQGTIVNGHIRLDTPSSLPEGTRVKLEVSEEAPLDELDAVPPPPSTESYEEHLARLRESIAEAKAGHTRPAREVLKELALKYDLPLLPGE